MPRVIFWAWERPENLTFLDPSQSGIAMLAGTITLNHGHIHCQPRLQPLKLPKGTPLLLTVRIEATGAPLPGTADVAACAIGLSTDEAAQALQIDFDARRSERGWYRELLIKLRQELPGRMALTMTALVSWCEGDGWIQDLPVAEAVPMLFRMGRGEVWKGRDFDVALCRSSVGVATDELPASLPLGRRVYFFHPSRWTEDSYHAAWREAGRLQ